MVGERQGFPIVKNVNEILAFSLKKGANAGLHGRDTKETVETCPF
jgi:hypothetical protein